MRPDHILHSISPSDWTEDESFQHLQATFDKACKDFPDLMEPYEIQYVLCEGEPHNQIAAMRQGLRETFQLRHKSATIQPAS